MSLLLPMNCLCGIFMHFQELASTVKNKKVDIASDSWLFEQKKHANIWTFHILNSYFEKIGHYAGFVANFVETEQIVIDLANPILSKPNCSFFRINKRFYSNILVPRAQYAYPETQNLNCLSKDINYKMSKKHIGDLFALYGEQIFALNLVKSNEKEKREKLIADEYQNAIDVINEDLQHYLKVKYLHFDMKLNLKRDKEEFVEKVSIKINFSSNNKYFLLTINENRCLLQDFYTIMKTGVFLVQNSSSNKLSQIVEFQNGVLRSNCIDCLDRTNTFQQLIGEMALGIQIQKLLKHPVRFKCIDVEPKIIENFREMYEQNGDLISLQYGSSIAHKQNIKADQKKRFEFLTSLQRHFRNNFSDLNRQHQIDLFLGNFIPLNSRKNIWDQEKKDQQNFPEIRKLDSIYEESDKWQQQAFNYYKKYNNITFFQELENENSPSDQKEFLKEYEDRLTRKNNHASSSSSAMAFNIDIIQKLKQSTYHVVNYQDKSKETGNLKSKGGIVVNLIVNKQINESKNYWFGHLQQTFQPDIYKNILYFNGTNSMTNHQLDIDVKDHSYENKANKIDVDDSDLDDQDEEDDVEEDEEGEEDMELLQKKQQAHNAQDSNQFLQQQQQSQYQNSYASLLYTGQSQELLQKNAQKRQLENESLTLNSVFDVKHKDILSRHHFVRNVSSKDSNAFVQEQTNQQLKLEFDRYVTNDFMQKYENSSDFIGEFFNLQSLQPDIQTEIEGQHNYFENLQTGMNEIRGQFENYIQGFYISQQTDLQQQQISLANNQNSERTQLQNNNINCTEFGNQSRWLKQGDGEYGRYGDENSMKYGKGNMINFSNCQQESKMDMKSNQQYSNSQSVGMSKIMHLQNSGTAKQTKLSKNQIDRRKMKVLEILMKRQFSANTQTKIFKI